MEIKDAVLDAMKKAGKPVSAGDIEKATGIERKEIDKAMKKLKTEDLIESPVRCMWQPK